MLDVAWPELVVIGAVALVAIGPKDLPRVMHSLGRWAAKARAMLHDFQGTLDRLSYESEIAEKLRAEDAKNKAAENKSPDKKETERDGNGTA